MRRVDPMQTAARTMLRELCVAWRRAAERDRIDAFRRAYVVVRSFRFVLPTLADVRPPIPPPMRDRTEGIVATRLFAFASADHARMLWFHLLRELDGAALPGATEHLARVLPRLMGTLKQDTLRWYSSRARRRERRCMDRLLGPRRAAMFRRSAAVARAEELPVAIALAEANIGGAIERATRHSYRVVRAIQRRPVTIRRPGMVRRAHRRARAALRRDGPSALATEPPPSDDGPPSARGPPSQSSPNVDDVHRYGG